MDSIWMTITWITSTNWAKLQTHCISFWWVHIFNAINDTISQWLIGHISNALHQPNPILMIQFIFSIYNPVQFTDMDPTVITEIDDGDLMVLELETDPISKCVGNSFHVHTLTHIHQWWSTNLSHQFHTSFTRTTKLYSLHICDTIEQKWPICTICTAPTYINNVITK